MPKSPAFRFYPGDFSSSPDVQAMDLHEVGAYTLLLCAAWQMDRHGFLPDDDDRLRRWARMSREQWGQSRAVLLAKFPLAEDGFRANPRMVWEAKKQAEYSKTQSEKGKQGGRPRKLELVEKRPQLVLGKPELRKTKPSVSVSVLNQKLSLPSATDRDFETDQDFLDTWNEHRHYRMPKARTLTRERKSKLASRRHDGVTLSKFRDAVMGAARDPFMRGETSRNGWVCSFDYLTANGTNLEKVLESRFCTQVADDSPTQVERYRRELEVSA